MLAATVLGRVLGYGLQLPARTLGDLAHMAGGLPVLHWPEVRLNGETVRIILPHAVLKATVGLLETRAAELRMRRAGSGQYCFRPVWRHERLRDDRPDHDQPRFRRLFVPVWLHQWRDDSFVYPFSVAVDRAYLLAADPARAILDCGHLRLADHSAIAAMECLVERYARVGKAQQ